MCGCVAASISRITGCRNILSTRQGGAEERAARPTNDDPGMKIATDAYSVVEISRRVQTGVDDSLDAARHALSVIARREQELYAWSHLASASDLVGASTLTASGP